MRGRPRLSTLTGGLLVMALGAWILLDAAGTMRITFAALAPALTAIIGVLLLTSGLEGRD